MKKSLCYLITTLLLSLSTNIWADTAATHRTALLTNDQVNVWKTIIYPSQHQQLALHRHEFNRVLIALDDGELKKVLGINSGFSDFTDVLKQEVKPIQVVPNDTFGF